MQTEKQFKGFDLFNDIEDKDLQRHNRAAILTTILEKFHRDGKVSAQGASVTLGYFNCIPEAERIDLLKEFVKAAAQRGFVLDGKPEEFND
jgi:hypothetical protein